ncbi:MAG: hypothetical protein ABJL67_23560 [Sulfitobacter sp.]
MDYLSKKDWRKHLKSKGNSDVKKTGISDLLTDYEKAVKKNSNSAQMSALERLLSKIDEVKRKWSKNATLGAHLDAMKKEAKAKEDKISNALNNEDDDTLSGSDSELGKSLSDVRTKATEDKPHQFVVAPGKPSTGLIIHKRKITPKHIKTAIKTRGKGGPYFQGTCYFAAGKYHFAFSEQPPNGLARAIKRAALLHAEMAIKVVCKGGGIEFDDDADDALGESGEARENRGGSANYPTAASFAPIINKILTLPEDKREAASGGTIGKLQQLIAEAKSDPSLDDQARKGVLDELELARDNIHAALDLPPPLPTSPSPGYPTLKQWKADLDACLRLAPEKRKPAISDLRAKLTSVTQALKDDDRLGDDELKTEAKVLHDAKKMIMKDGRRYMDAAMSAHRSGDQGRLRELETEFDIMRKQTTLTEKIQKNVAKEILRARKVLAKGNAEKNTEALDRLEGIIRTANSVAFGANRREDKENKQNRIFDSVKQGIEVFQKGAFATGTADAIFKERKGEKLDKGSKELRDLFRDCEKDQSPANLDKLSKQGQAYLKTLAEAKAKLDAGKDNDAAKIAMLDNMAKRAKQAVQRARLLELANEMDAVGSPPWSDSDGEKMAELQVAFFFEEGVIKLGETSFGAPQLSGLTDEAGVNEAWWIERVDTDADRPSDPSDPDSEAKKSSKKTYIFKPQDLEASNMVGIPEKGGSVREVLASRMSDQLIDFGFEIGVCPTHMVKIDTAKLDGLADTGEEKIFGAVQELGENDGPVAYELQKDPDGFAKLLDHKNISDIVVFDLMFLSADRHAKNLLVQDQPDGTKKLLPIDHGIGLPDPDGLAMFRDRMTGQQNVLMDDSMRPDELFDEETRANLKNLDPKKIIDEARKAQADSEGRHPETAGKLDPGEFDRMEHRLEFMKAAADILTSREMTQAIAIHASTINKTAPKDMEKLAKTLKQTLEANNEGSKMVAALTTANPMHPHLEIQKLGWCLGMSKSQLAIWVNENGALAVRILKGQILAPAAIKLRDDLLQKAGPTALTDTQKSAPINEQIDALRNLLKNAAKDQERKDNKSKVDDMGGPDAALKTLNANGKLDELSKLFPGTRLRSAQDSVDALLAFETFEALGGEAEFKNILRVFPDRPPTNVSAASRYLRDWKAIEALGGIKKFIELGGTNDVDTEPGSIVEMFESLLRISEAGDGDKLLTEPLDKFDKVQEARLKKQLKELQNLIKTILLPKNLTPIQKMAAEVVSEFKKKDYNAAQAGMTKVMHAAIRDSTSEAEHEKVRMEKLGKLKKDFVTLKAKDPSADYSALEKAFSEAEAMIKSHDHYTADTLILPVELELDKALNGDDSWAVKFEALRRDAVARVQKVFAATEFDPKNIQVQWGAVHQEALRDPVSFERTYQDYAKKLDRIDTYLELFKSVARFDGDDGAKAEIQKALNVIKTENIERVSEMSFDNRVKKLKALLGEPALA